MCFLLTIDASFFQSFIKKACTFSKNFVLLARSASYTKPQGEAV